MPKASSMPAGGMPTSVKYASRNGTSVPRSPNDPAHSLRPNWSAVRGGCCAIASGESALIVAVCQQEIRLSRKPQVTPYRLNLWPGVLPEASCPLVVGVGEEELLAADFVAGDRLLSVR